MQHFDFEVTIDRFDEDVKRLYTMLRPGVELDEISECLEMEGGFVNGIVKMNDSKSNDPPQDPVVVRVHLVKLIKSMTEEERKKPLPIDRVLELEVLRKSSELDISARLLATFKNGFIYRFVDGVTNTFELYDFQLAERIAIKMARLHHMRLDDRLVNSMPAVLWFLGKDDYSRERRVLFDKKMEESEFEELREHLPNYSSLSEEYERLHDLVMERGAYGPICLCHNDLNLSNLLVDRHTKEPIFIDFEWANTNFQMFDISYHLYCVSNVFCESFNPEQVPSAAFIRHWLRGYYEESNRMDNIRMTDEEFEKFLDDEMKKALVNMLLIRILLVQRTLLFIFNIPGKVSLKAAVKYAVEIYEDFVRNRDEHLKLLDDLKK